MNIKKILYYLLWVIRYPRDVWTGAGFGAHNDILKARPIWLMQAFFIGLAIFQASYLFLPLFVSGLPVWLVPAAVGMVAFLGNLIGGLPNSKEPGTAFTRAKLPPILQSANTARKIFCCGMFWAGVASLLIWWVLYEGYNEAYKTRGHDDYGFFAF